MGLLDSVKNKVSHSINKTLTDPEADKWAKEKAEKDARDAAAAADAAAQEAAKKRDEQDKAAQQEAARKLQQRRKFTAKDAGKVALSTFSSVFISLLVIALMLHAGSLCANDAIARSMIYRIVFFIYGAVPFFAVFILIYYHIYRRYKGTMPRVFTVLPLRVLPEQQSVLMSYLLSPFTYKPDMAVIGTKETELKKMWDDAVSQLTA
jgi:cation transport ATPase